MTITAQRMLQVERAVQQMLDPAQGGALAPPTAVSGPFPLPVCVMGGSNGGHVVQFLATHFPDAIHGAYSDQFSATMRQTLQSVVHAVFGEDPLHIRTRGSSKLVRTLKTVNRRVDDGRRVDVLRKVMREDRDVGTLLFANTRAQCDVIAEWLDEEGIEYVAYMGEMDRTERRKNLAKFRDGEVSVLLTTDLGGRGLDIERVDRVVNVHLPKDADNYLHRVGRTARAGREGLVVNLVTERDKPLIDRLKRMEYSPH